MAERSFLESIAYGAAHHTIYFPEAKAFWLCVPSVPDQQRIVGVLDEAFEGIATAKANVEQCIRSTRDLIAHQLDQLIADEKWTWTTLGELCEDVEYGSSAKSKARGKVSVLRMGNIRDGQLDWTNLVYSDDDAEIEKYLLSPGDVLFNRTNSPELVGKTAVYRGEQPAIFAGYLIRINRKQDRLDADFLNYFLNSKIAFDYGRSVMSSSVNQANINGTKLKGYPFPLMPLVEQESAVAKLNELTEQTRQLTEIAERKLAALDALKQSLLHHAFTGQL